jgi:hypothetical protein
VHAGSAKDGECSITVYQDVPGPGQAMRFSKRLQPALSELGFVALS